MAAAMGSVAKNGREPDWGRFGLDDEKQPLNPSSAENGMDGGTANHENKELYGGQAQNKNELFAQDQVCLINSFLSSREHYTKTYIFTVF